jgi:hypothetical protein
MVSIGDAFGRAAQPTVMLFIFLLPEKEFFFV